jgi:hypothetical protein
MSIYINGIAILADAVVEPVSLTDAKTWLRVDYDDDNVLINNLISAARVHIEKLTGCSLVNKVIRTNIELTGSEPMVWMVDLPYTPLNCVDEVKYKNGINMFTTLVKDQDFEIIGGKIWFYAPGYYIIKYQAGFSTLPTDLKNDILTLVAWAYENRGKRFQGSDVAATRLTEYPFWDGLNYHQYKKVVI